MEYKMMADWIKDFLGIRSQSYFYYFTCDITVAKSKIFAYKSFSIQNLKLLKFFKHVFNV